MDKDSPEQQEQDPLEEAILNLEQFTQQNESEAFPHVQNLTVKDKSLLPEKKSSLEKTMDLFAAVSSSVRQKHNEKRLQVQNTLMESIDFLKSHYRIINKRKHGTKEEQEWARWAQQTINRYNALLTRSKQAHHSLHERIIQFFYEQSGLSLDKEVTNNKIEIPHEFTVQFDSSKDRSGAATLKPQEQTLGKINTLLQHANVATVNPSLPTQEEKDAFHMKSIVLAAKSDLPVSLRQYMNAMMRETPIQTNISKPTEEGADIVSLNQTLSPLPGEKIVIKGAFKRDSKSHVLSVPIPESFHVSTKATQTGSPHPSQHTGWALPDVLFPECPHRLDQLPLFTKIYEQKKRIAANLLPSGSMNELAKQLLKLRKRVFELNLKEFLDLHRKLSLSILAASVELEGSIHEAAIEEVDHFYQVLESSPLPFEMMTRTYQELNKLFLEMPYENILHEWSEKRNARLKNMDSKALYHACVQIFDESIEKTMEDIGKQIDKTPSEAIEDKYMLKYMQEMGPILGKASRAVMLQQLSEKIGFAPPLLNIFEQKLQLCAYLQLMAFHEELQDPKVLTEEGLKKKIEKHLKEEIQLFQSESCEQVAAELTEVVNELEFYYNARHFSRL